jgi:hypothetical protein
MKIERNHLKALLTDPEIRQATLDCLDDPDLLSLDIESLSACDFDTLRDAAWEALGDINPVVKTYSVRGGDGEDYPIQIIGVRGAYFVSPLEEDDVGMFATLEEAEGYIGFNWLGDAREDIP